MPIADRIGEAARVWPERLAVVDAGRPDGRFTYGALDDRAGRLAAWLRDEAGIDRGDRVALLARNGIEYLDALHACGKLGATFAPINWRLHPEELRALAGIIRAGAIIASDEFADGAAALRIGGTKVLRLDGYEAALATAPSGAVTPAVVDPEEIACLLLTGGTTGTPKAARISHRMIAWNTLTTIVHELERDDVTITHTPMFHTGGLLVYTVPLLTVGGSVVIMPRWEPDEMLALVERERVTVFFCVPAQYAALLDAPRFASTDFGSVRFLTSGGAPLPVSLLERWRAVHDTPFKQGFGMTEFGPGAFSMGPAHAVAKAGSIGRPNMFVEAAVLASPTEVGELILRGPAAFSGYLGATDEPAFDADGWFHTGDLARVDEDGFYFIVDRVKDMYVSGGENVYPAEVEAVLRRHPAVVDCAVIGIPDARWGEVGCAFVVSRDDGLTPEVLIGLARGALAAYKAPKQVRFVDALPRSAAGKVLKQRLRDLPDSGSAR